MIDLAPIVGDFAEDKDAACKNPERTNKSQLSLGVKR